MGVELGMKEGIALVGANVGVADDGMVDGGADDGNAVVGAVVQTTVECGLLGMPWV